MKNASNLATIKRVLWRESVTHVPPNTNSHCKGSFSMPNFRKVILQRVFIFGDTKKKKKKSSFKNNEKIHKREDRSYYEVSADKASSVIL